MKYSINTFIYIYRLEAVEAKRDEIFRDAAKILLRNIPKRIPLTEDMIAAGILDPCIQHLPVINDWLDAKKISRVDLLTKIITTNNITFSEEAQQTQQQTSLQPIKDYRLLILQRHAGVTSTSSNLVTELIRFNSLKEEVSDVLAFWRQHQCNYPQLAQIAKVILCKPATSAKSESAFSVAGALISKKRASIDPLRAQKVLFIHDNYDLLKCGEL